MNGFCKNIFKLRMFIFSNVDVFRDNAYDAITFVVAIFATSIREIMVYQFTLQSF